MSALATRSEPTRADEAWCPVCGGAEVRPARPDTVAGRTILACPRCETIFVWPRLEQDFELLPESSYYNDWQALDLDTLEGLFADVMASRRRRVALWAAHEVARPSILEVGCGAGHALIHFRANGWRARGIDPWRAVTEAGRKYYRLPIETGRIETATTVEPESQDIVMAIDVLQFIAAPRGTLDACFTALKQGGMLYLTVPNFGSTTSRREGWNWHHFIPTSYLTYFTTDNLTRLVQAAGFEKLEILVFGGPDDDGFLRVAGRRPWRSELSWADLGDEVPDADLPPLDRRTVPLERLSPSQRSWCDNGYVILSKFIPDDLIDRYCAVRKHLNMTGGWPSPTPYLAVPEIRDLCLYDKLSDMLEHLLGEPMALHLNLTGWVSTERDWHQDDYLNPPEVNSHYAAVWIALDEIKPDSGPFEFVPGSHRWPFIRQANVLSLLGREDNADPSWPWDSERLLTPFFESEITRHGCGIKQFLGNKGDVLIWHSRLLHRGSLAERPDAERRAMIAHYSAVSRRSDMPTTRRHPGGGLYFVPSLRPTGRIDTAVSLFDRLRAGGLAFCEADGKLCATFAANGGFYTVDKATGAATLITINNVDYGLAFAPQEGPARPISYSVKFICGIQDSDELEQGVIRPGIYSTEINIHNYHGTEVAVRKLVLPLVFDGKPRGREPEYVRARAQDSIVLPPNTATMDDCFQIGQLLYGGPPPQPLPLMIGYLEIVSTLPLAVYTVTDRERRSIAIDIKRVEGRPKSES